MGHKYKVETVTRFDDGSKRKGIYYASSIAQIIDLIERNPKGCGYEHTSKYPDLYREYFAFCTVDHFITRIY